MAQGKGNAVVTTIRVPKSVWMLLRALAEQRAEQLGGRPSVSGLIVELAQKAKAPRHA